jgi:hypothetical protein
MAQPQETTFSQAQVMEMMEAMLRTVVAEIRKPSVDPIKEIQKAREKKTKDEANASMWSSRLSKLLRCAHSRQDGTCIIGWAKQSDGIERGYCPNCDNLIGPELVQAFPERADEMRKLYEDQRRRPRGLMENVRYVNS